MSSSPVSTAALGDLITHLRECVVAIAHGDSKGTGFFIAPNTVLTCAHVLENEAGGVQVRWRDRSKDAKIAHRADKDEPDLAILRLEDDHSAWDHPCVLVDEEFVTNDLLYTFGHPDGDYREGGDSATFTSDGDSYEFVAGRKIEHYKFSHGEVAPGFSGSPLLNQRTGKVCGVVERTRQRDSDIGGRAVPIHYLRALDPQLWASLGAYHHTHPLWTSLIKQLTAAPQAPLSLQTAATVQSAAPVDRGQDAASKLQKQGHKARRSKKEKADRLSTQTASTVQATPAVDRGQDTALLVRKLEENEYRTRKSQKATVDHQRYSAYAESFIVEKTLNNDGSSKVDYLVKGLRVERGSLVGLRFVFHSEAGFVGGPTLNQEAKQRQISWQWESELRSKALPLGEKLQSVRSLNGTFIFDELLRFGNPPLDFGWTINVLNGDALSDWEFEHLYSDVKQVHMNGRPLTFPMEYFARVIWFPIGTLTLRLNLPSRIVDRAFLSVFQCSDQVNVPEDEVVSQGILQSFPRSQSAWVQQNVKWQRDPIAERWEKATLIAEVKEGRSYEFTCREPQVGWCYSLDWPLPKPSLDSDFDYLVRKSNVIRNDLIAHAERRKSQGGGPQEAQIQKLFAEFDTEIRKRYASTREDCLLISLMTYNTQLRRLVVIEGAQGGTAAKELEPRNWGFWLPFGLGLAGACFREGDVQYYVHPTPASEDADYYLALSEGTAYEVLVALPLDHPETSDQIVAADSAERCRQLVGVMTLGSSYAATKLLRLRDTVEKKSSQVVEPEIVRLRNRCQGLANQIVELLQPS